MSESATLSDTGWGQERSFLGFALGSLLEHHRGITITAYARLQVVCYFSKLVFSKA